MPAFDLVTSEAELPGRVGRSRDTFELLAPGRNAASSIDPTDPDNFGQGGTLSFDISLSRGEWLDLENSGVAIDYVLYREDAGGTLEQLVVGDQIAPALFTASNLFKAANFYLNGTKLESVTDQYAATSAYLERTTRPKAWLDSVGNSLFNAGSFQERINKYALDGGESAIGSGLIPVAMFGLSEPNPGPPTTQGTKPENIPKAVELTTSDPAPAFVNLDIALMANTTNAAGFAVTGGGGEIYFRKTGSYYYTVSAQTTRTGSNNSYVTLKRITTYAVGGVDEQEFIIPQVAVGTGFNGNFSETNFVNVTSNDKIIWKAAATGAVGGGEKTFLDLQVMFYFVPDSAVVDVASAERITGQRLMHRPPLSTWYPEPDMPLLPAGQFRLDLDPDVSWASAAVETLNNGQPGTAFVVRITNVQLIIHKVFGAPVDDASYLIPLYPCVCTQRSTRAIVGQQRVYFDTHASAQELGVAFRDRDAGSNTRYNPAMFRPANEADRRVRRLYIEFDSVTKPSQAQLSEFKTSDVSIRWLGVDNTGLNYFESLAQKSMEVSAIGSESLRDMRNRGYLWAFDWPRDPSSRATRAYVNFEYASNGLPNADSSVLFFERYWSAAQVSIQNAQVVNVTVREA